MNLGRFIVSRAKKVAQKESNKESSHTGREKVKQDLNKLFNSIAHLFEPFKKAVLSMFPKVKPLILLLDKIALFVAKVVTLIVYIAFFALNFIKGKLFKFLVIVFIALFLFSVVLSRVINTTNYKNYFQDALSDITGYQASVDGSIKVSIVPSPSIFINNVSFNQVGNTPSQKDGSVSINVFETNKVKLSFKFLSLFLGKLTVDSVQIEGANFVLKTSFSKDKTDSRSLDGQIEQIFQKFVQRNSSRYFDKQEQDSFNEGDGLSHNTDIQDYNSQEFFTQQSDSILPNSQKTSNQVADDFAEGSFFMGLNRFFISRIELDPNKVDSFTYRRVNVVVLNQRENNVFSVQNLGGYLERGITGSLESEGYFFTGKEKHSYNFYSSRTSEGGKEIDFSLYLGERSENQIRAEGTVNFEKSAMDLKTSASSGAINYLLALSSANDSFFDTSAFKSANFSANLVANNKLVELKNINLDVNHSTNITGSLSMVDGFSSNAVKLDIDVNSANMANFVRSYQERAQKNRSMGQANISYLFVYLNSLHSSFYKVFDATHTFSNINFKSLNESNPVEINVNLNRDSKGQYYLNNLSANYKQTEVSLAGFLYPELSQAKLVSNAQGSFDDFLNLLNVSPSSYKAIKAASKDSRSFSTAFDLSVQNSKVYFSNIMLKFDELEFNNMQVNLEERVSIIDVALTVKNNKFDYDYFLNILRPSENMSGSNLLSVEKDSFFGISDKLNINLKLESEEFEFDNILLKNLKVDASLNSSGITVQRFDVQSQEQGSALLFFSYNKNVNPALAGNITFNNFALNLEDINKYMFSEYKVKGKVVLNGRLRSSNMTSAGFLSMLQGDIRFVKLERFKSNKTNNSKGFFLTLSKSNKKIDGKTEIYINDLYGSLQAFSGRFDFFPVVVDYIHGKTKGRGSFEGSYRVEDSFIDIRGNISRTAKSSKPMAYYFKGSLAQPEYKFSKSDGSIVIKNPEIKPKEEKKVERSAEAKEIEKKAIKEVRSNIKNTDTNRQTNIDTIGGVGAKIDNLVPSENLRGTDFSNTEKISNPGSSKVNPNSLVPEQLGRTEVEQEKTEEQKRIQELEKATGIENKQNIKVETEEDPFGQYPVDRNVLDSSKREQEVGSVRSQTIVNTGRTQSTEGQKEEPKSTFRRRNTNTDSKPLIPQDADPELWE